MAITSYNVTLPASNATIYCYTPYYNRLTYSIDTSYIRSLNVGTGATVATFSKTVIPSGYNAYSYFNTIAIKSKIYLSFYNLSGSPVFKWIKSAGTTTYTTVTELNNYGFLTIVNASETKVRFFGLKYVSASGSNFLFKQAYVTADVDIDGNLSSFNETLSDTTVNATSAVILSASLIGVSQNKLAFVHPYLGEFYANRSEDIFYDTTNYYSIYGTNMKYIDPDKAYADYTFSISNIIGTFNPSGSTYTFYNGSGTADAFNGLLYDKDTNTTSLYFTNNTYSTTYTLYRFFKATINLGSHTFDNITDLITYGSNTKSSIIHEKNYNAVVYPTTTDYSTFSIIPSYAAEFPVTNISETLTIDAIRLIGANTSINADLSREIAKAELDNFDSIRMTTSFLNEAQNLDTLRLSINHSILNRSISRAIGYGGNLSSDTFRNTSKLTTDTIDTIKKTNKDIIDNIDLIRSVNNKQIENIDITKKVIKDSNNITDTYRKSIKANLSSVDAIRRSILDSISNLGTNRRKGKLDDNSSEIRRPVIEDSSIVNDTYRSLTKNISLNADTIRGSNLDSKSILDFKRMITTKDNSTGETRRIVINKINNNLDSNRKINKLNIQDYNSIREISQDSNNAEDIFRSIVEDSNAQNDIARINIKNNSISTDTIRSSSVNSKSDLDFNRVIGIKDDEYAAIERFIIYQANNNYDSLRAVRALINDGYDTIRKNVKDDSITNDSLRETEYYNKSVMTFPNSISSYSSLYGFNNEKAIIQNSTTNYSIYNVRTGQLELTGALIYRDTTDYIADFGNSFIIRNTTYILNAYCKEYGTSGSAIYNTRIHAYNLRGARLTTLNETLFNDVLAITPIRINKNKIRLFALYKYGNTVKGYNYGTATSVYTGEVQLKFNYIDADIDNDGLMTNIVVKNDRSSITYVADYKTNQFISLIYKGFNTSNNGMLFYIPLCGTDLVSLEASLYNYTYNKITATYRNNYNYNYYTPYYQNGVLKYISVDSNILTFKEINKKITVNGSLLKLQYVEKEDTYYLYLLNSSGIITKNLLDIENQTLTFISNIGSYTSTKTLNGIYSGATAYIDSTNSCSYVIPNLVKSINDYIKTLDKSDTRRYVNNIVTSDFDTLRETSINFYSDIQNLDSNRKVVIDDISNMDLSRFNVGSEIESIELDRITHQGETENYDLYSLSFAEENSPIDTLKLTVFDSKDNLGTKRISMVQDDEYEETKRIVYEDDSEDYDTRRLTGIFIDEKISEDILRIVHRYIYIYDGLLRTVYKNNNLLADTKRNLFNTAAYNYLMDCVRKIIALNNIENDLDRKIMTGAEVNLYTFRSTLFCINSLYDLVRMPSSMTINHIKVDLIKRIIKDNILIPKTIRSLSNIVTNNVDTDRAIAIIFADVEKYVLNAKVVDDEESFTAKIDDLINNIRIKIQHIFNKDS